MHLIDQQLNLMIRGRVKEAWKISEMLHEQDPTNIRHLFNRGWFLINQGKYQEGFQSLEAGRFVNAYGSPHLVTDKTIWDQEDLTNKTVVINMEGGFGDCFIFVRFAKEIQKRGGKCIICCSPSLFGIFSRVEAVEKCVHIGQILTTPHDFWIPSFSCSWLFGHTFETIPNEPYIIPNPLSVEVWKNIINSKKIKVGIRWSGSPQFEHQQFRIFPPEPLTDLYTYDQLQLYSFQKNNDIKELPEEIVDLQHILISWDDTAAAIYNMDLVITSCTSIAHLSAAMGKPTWVIVPLLPYHIWAYGDRHSPWYKNSTRIFRQKEFSDWNKTFDLLYKELIVHFDLKKD